MALEDGGGTTVLGTTVTWEVRGRVTLEAAGAAMATVTRAEEASGGAKSTSSTSTVGTAECATPDGSTRRGPAVADAAGAVGPTATAKLGGTVGRTCLAAAAAFCFFAISALEVSAVALFFEG